MTRRLTITWPDRAPFGRRDGAPIRLLAVSDEPDRVLDHEVNRAALGPIDAIVGCGDLASDYLAFLADAFGAPLVRVLGNHDRLEADEVTGVMVAEPVGAGVTSVAPVPVLGLPWPGDAPVRDERLAWAQALRLAAGRLVRHGPVLVASHIPPRGAGDLATDHYHLGSPAYRWLLGRLRPPLWLHGHTPLAGVDRWRVECGATTLVNVTGSVLVELRPPGD